MSENFQALLAELNQAAEDQNVLAKSVAAAGADDQAIQAAAAEGDKNPEDEEEMAKSAAAAAEAAAAGTVAGAGAPTDEPILIDGDEIIKSLGLMEGRMTATEETLTKGLTTALDLIKGQQELIKSMGARLDKLGSTGAGRKTMLQVHEKPAAGEHLAKSQPQGITPTEILAKANAAFDAKKITGLELTALDVSLRNGQVPSESTLTKILS